jgi:hypothetical protein
MSRPIIINSCGRIVIANDYLKFRQSLNQSFWNIFYTPLKVSKIDLDQDILNWKPEEH